MKRIAAIATTVAVLSLGLAGCSSATPGTMPELPKQDISRWVMPLDAFSSPLRDSLPTYAEDRWMETCLGKEGINWPILAQPTDETSAMVPPANMSGFPILTAEVAKQYGYSASRYPGRDQAHPDQSDKLNAIARATPGFDPLFGSCLKEIRKRLDTISVTDSMNRITMWQDEAMNAAYAEPSVKNAGAAWKKCLVAAGYPITLSAPVGDGEWMPTQALGVSLGFFPAPPSTVAPVPQEGSIGARGDVSGGGSSGPAPLTSAEVQLAVADATCRESSGWTAAMYQAMWTAEVDQVKQHADDLVRTKTQLDALLKESLAVIAENPPKS
jgi:hypothetical protein